MRFRSMIRVAVPSPFRLPARKQGPDLPPHANGLSYGQELMRPVPRCRRPVNWLGREVRELLSGDGKQVVRFDGKGFETAAAPPVAGGCRVLMTADLWGNYRDEIV